MRTDRSMISSSWAGASERRRISSSCMGANPSCATPPAVQAARGHFFRWREPSINRAHIATVSCPSPCCSRLKASHPGCAAPTKPQPALGEAIRQLRQKRDITQEDLAHEADITTGTLSLIERGHANPTWGTVKGIGAALSVSMGELGRLVDKLDA